MLRWPAGSPVPPSPTRLPEGGTGTADWPPTRMADKSEALLDHRRSEFPEEAFAPLPVFVAGQPPDIDPATAATVFQSITSAAAHVFDGDRPQQLRRPRFEEPRTVLPPLTVPEAVVPEAVVPEAVVPEAVVPEAVVPEAVVPEAVVPEAVVPPLPPPADGVAVVHVAGLRKRCYRCGSETTVVAGLLAYDSATGSIDDEPRGTGRELRGTAARPRYRYVRLSPVIELLASMLDDAWYSVRGIAPLARRRREASLQFTGELVELANGCSTCGVLLRSQPIEEGFEHLVANGHRIDEQVLDTITVPAVILEQVQELPSR